MLGTDPPTTYPGPLWPSLLLAAGLLVVAGWMVYTHVRSWRFACRQDDIAKRELDYRRNQFRRRMQTSVMLAVLAVGLVVGQVLIRFRVGGPWMIVVFWLVMIVLVFWLVLLAVADMLATGAYFGRLRQDYRVEEARLQAQLRQWQRKHQQAETTGDNGRAAAGGSNGRRPHA